MKKTKLAEKAIEYPVLLMPLSTRPSEQPIKVEKQDNAEIARGVV